MEKSEDEKAEARYRSSLPGALGAIDDGIGKLEAAILGFGVMAMALNTVANVIGRFVFGESLFFTEEVNRILIVLVTFAGIGYAARHGRHIRMSAFFDALPKSARRWLMIVMCLFTALMMFALCYFSTGYLLSVMSRGRSLPALSIPAWWMYVWVPIGFAVTGLQYLMTAITNLLSDDVYLSTHVVDGYDDPEIDR
ncbi:TRAP transporter small permease [Halomonas dongshanensis]|uniref:TRAP transporter small permease protein n=1 Tax=Halomonas dongshanensis TaxID=2890835 RepID=A0ABT2E8P0_9GAMM|nr:TRAP transporter small permease [Halomonas dongshanensis]MCS2607932.1 TRAP transporter small permease [Halomonas dongshanensis]